MSDPAVAQQAATVWVDLLFGGSGVGATGVATYAVLRKAGWWPKTTINGCATASKQDLILTQISNNHDQTERLINSVEKVATSTAAMASDLRLLLDRGSRQ